MVVKIYLKKLNREIIIVAFFSLLFAILNLWHVFYYWLKKPAGTIFIGITHWYEDYFFYLSQLTQGANGRWSLANKYTTEIVPNGFNWTYNLLLGKLAMLLPWQIWTIYDLSILVLTIIYIYLCYLVIKWIYPNHKWLSLASLLIAFTSTSFAGSTQVFYSYTTAFNRLGGVSHHLFQNILSLLSLYIFVKVVQILGDKTKSHQLLKLIFLNCTVLSFLFVISAFFALMNFLVFTTATIWSFLAHKNKNILKKTFIVLFVMLLPIIPIAFYQANILNSPFWRAVRIWETNIQPVDLLTFLLSFGLIIFILPFGLPGFLKKPGFLKITGFFYIFLPLLFYFSPLPRMLAMPYFRLLQPPAYVFLGIIACEGLIMFSKFFKKQRKAAFGAFLTFYLIFQVPGLAREIQARKNEYYLNSPLNFLDKGAYEGLVYLKTLPRNKIVMAIGTIENLIPVISGHTVYVGHATLTIDYKRKIKEVSDFYLQKVNSDQGLVFLKNNKIAYLVWQNKDGDPKSLLNYYQFLEVIFQNSKLTIFKVK